MTVKELIAVLSKLDGDLEVMIEGRDFTGEYCGAEEMTEKHIHVGDERIYIVAE